MLRFKYLFVFKLNIFVCVVVAAHINYDQTNVFLERAKEVLQFCTLKRWQELLLEKPQRMPLWIIW